MQCDMIFRKKNSLIKNDDNAIFFVKYDVILKIDCQQ